MHEQLSELSFFFDPLAVAAALRDALDAQTSEFKTGKHPQVVRASRTATVNDHDILLRLLPPELYSFWREAGYVGMYSMTFMLRHAVTFLALAAHEKAYLPDTSGDSCNSLSAFMHEHFNAQYETSFQECFELICPVQPSSYFKQQSPIPVVGFSSLGVHLLYRNIGMCRAFDYYDIDSCSTQADGRFCQAHASEAWWRDGGNKVSTQADMFRFYTSLENLHTSDEQHLQELIGQFWIRFRKSYHPPTQTSGILADAIVFFKYVSLQECLEGGLIQLHKRYTELAKVLHPDTGGVHASFVELQKYYEVLRKHLNYVCAGFLG